MLNNADVQKAMLDRRARYFQREQCQLFNLRIVLPVTLVSKVGRILVCAKDVTVMATLLSATVNLEVSWEFWAFLSP